MISAKKNLTLLIHRDNCVELYESNCIQYKWERERKEQKTKFIIQNVKFVDLFENTDDLSDH